MSQELDISTVTLSPEQDKLFTRFESSLAHMFITGKAGTGKSVLLQYIRQHTLKNYVVLAPTGVAALNVGGQTIHSFFLLPPTFIEVKHLRLNSRITNILKKLDTIIIDEVSMVRADLMDAIDFLLKKARGNSLPFGGVQMLLFGDLYQLPPVVNDPDLLSYFAINNGGHYFFNSNGWNGTELEIYELTQNFRQTDETFKTILNAIRIGEADDNIINSLNARASQSVPQDNVIVLATTNATVFNINSQRLSALPSSEFEYMAAIDGDLDESAFPTEKTLKLKPGAQIMMLKNDPKKRWVNGTIGTVDSVTAKTINVKIDGQVYPLAPETWNKVRYFLNPETRALEEEVISSFTQFPLRLAWAITIHKSQGQTYNSVVLDLGFGAFAHGQTYVALSRCRSLETLYLKRPLTPRDIIIDPAIVEFMKQANINRL